MEKNKVENSLKQEQLIAINHDLGNAIVSASAGSGKTFVMIERIIRLLSEKKATLKDILAVTFTDAAAADMKEKLKKALTKKVAAGEKWAEKEISELYLADISTLHSFCSKILRSYFFAAGIAPDFKIIDETLSSALRAESAASVLKRFYDEKDQDFLMLVNRHLKNRSTQDLISLIMNIYDVSCEEINPELWFTKHLSRFSEEGFSQTVKKYSKEVFAVIESCYETALSALAAFKENGVTKGEEFCEGFISALKTVSGKDVYAVKNLDYNLRNGTYGGKNLAPELKTLKENVNAANTKFKELIKSVKEHFSDESTDKARVKTVKTHADALIKVVKAFKETYERLKKEENSLDFNDLQRYTLQVLENDDVLKEISEKFKYVFVDEYQDINPLQEEILTRITKDSLFMVGDVKQSIYGFRGCRPEFFINKRKVMKETGQTAVDLNFNFRSAAEVINAVNRVFDYSYTLASAGVDYKKEARLTPGGVYPKGAEGRATLHILSKETKQREAETPRIYDVIKEAQNPQSEEDSNVSQLIAKIIKAETLSTYYDRDEKCFKKVNYKDIAVLSRRKDGKFLKQVVNGLIRRDIPVVSDVKVNVCEYPEIKTLIWFLRLLDCFLQDIPLINVMLSPLGNFTEEELFSAVSFCEDAGYKTNGFCSAFSYVIKDENFTLKDKFAKFKAHIDGLRDLSDFMGAKGILRKVIEDCDYENYLLCETHGEEKLNRLYKFVSESETGGKVLTVSEFLRKIDVSEKAFLLPLGEDENAVKFMTIHASKGLEFPVTIVCGLEHAFFKRDETPSVIVDRDDGLFPKFFDDETRTYYETPARALKKLKMAKKRVTEELRLFYVALTRAEYSLNMVCEGDAREKREIFNGADNFMGFIPQDFPAKTYSEDDFISENLKRENRKVIIASDEEEITNRLLAAYSYEYPHAKDLFVPLKNSVTAAAKEKAQDYYPVQVVVSEETTGKDAGIVAHKIMQFYDFNRISDFDAQIKEMVNKGVISKEELSLINTDRLKTAIKSPEFSSLYKKECYREQDFTVNVPAFMVFDTESREPVLLQGIIDLLAIDGDNAEIIDYKYSVLPPASLKKKYERQLELYSYAVSLSLNKKVVKTSLINLFSGETITVKSEK